VELAFDEGTVARAVQRLTNAGWLMKERDGRDGRAFRVYLAPRAHEVMPRVLQELEAWNGLLGQGFTAEEREIALKLLVRMAENADRQGR
jgi:DNA-binding MarR family transcriptional regulator